MSTGLAADRKNVSGGVSNETAAACSLSPEGHTPCVGPSVVVLSWRRGVGRLVFGAVLALSLASGPSLDAQVLPADTTPPTITLTAPSGPFVNDATPTIVVSYSDDISGVNVTDLAIQLDGFDLSPSCTITTASATCEAPELAEGSHTIEARVGDRAGNRTTASFSFSVDVTPPDIAMAFNGGLIFADGFESGDVSAWSGGQSLDAPQSLNQGDLITGDVPLKGVPLKDLIFMTTTLGVVVTYSDALSGIDSTTLAIAIDGELLTGCVIGPESTICAPSELEEGTYLVTASISDLAGNSSSVNETVILDVRPPMITATADPPANAAGWHTTAVTVTFVCEDAVSGVATCPEPVIVSGEGAGQEVVGTAVDVAGNSGSTTLVVNIDSTPPMITATADPPTNAAGWNNSAVTVTFDCQDALSGVAACPDPVVLDGEGAGQEAAGTVFDVAGNLAMTTVVVNIDSMPPTFDPAEFQPAPCPAVATDLMAPVAACFADLLSGVVAGTVQLQVDGVDRTGSAVIAEGCISWVPTEAFTAGEHQAEIAATDLAGNADSASWCFAIVSPDIEITIDTPLDGFITNQATIDVSGTVDLSADTVDVNGVAAVVAGGTFQALGVPLDEGSVTLTAVAASAGGGAGSASVTVIRDSIPPTITATVEPPANAAGWHREAATVTFDCADVGSGVASCSDPVTVSGEVAGQEITGTATDLAGNSAETMVTLRLDLTPPTIGTMVAPSANAAGWHNAPPTVSFDCNDALSGVASCSTPRTLSSEGADQIASGTAIDLAGNSATTDAMVSIDLSPPTFDPAALRPVQCQGAVTTESRPQVQACFADAFAGVDEASVTLTVDGIDRSGVAVVDAGCVSWDPAVDFGPGEHQAEATATDVAGNSGAVSWCFEVALLPIAVTIDSPTANVQTRDDAIDVTGTVETGVDSVTVNGVVASVSGTSFTAVAVPLREGKNVITAVARTAVGNSGTASVVVLRDTKAPRIAIETPRNGAVLTSLQVDVAGQVNDLIAGTTINADDCDVTVNGVEAMVANRSFLVPGLLLKRGVNTLTAVASDRLGNSSTAAINVRVEDQAGQRIVLLAGSGQSAGIFEELPDRLVVALENASGDAVVGRPVTFEVSRGTGVLRAFPAEGTRVTVLTDDLGHASVVYELGGRSGAGNNRVLATAPGFLGEVEFCANTASGAPLRVVANAGDQQSGATGGTLPQSLVALVTDAGGNPVGGVDVTFEVLQGGGSFAGSPTAVSTTDLDGLAEALWTLGLEAGIENNAVGVTFPGLVESGAAFTASALRVGSPSATRVSGVVLDNQDNPVPGATVTIDDTALTAVTDDQGQFSIAGAPIGFIQFHVDGSTTSLPGEWPNLPFELTTTAGRDNSIGRPIYLLPFDLTTTAPAAGTEDVTLSLANVPGSELTVFANSVTCADGSTNCEVSVTQVRNERVPMQPPLGSSFMLAWTIQPTGATFDPPARICIPNTDQLPGQQVEIFSFDHDQGEFIAVGTATVMADGSQICSDPGFGIVEGGWHSCTPPPPPCTPGGAGSCDDNDDNVCTEKRRVSQECSFTCEPVDTDGRSCDDDDKCTEMDMCTGNQCGGEEIEVMITDAPTAICEGTSKPVTATTTPAGRSVIWMSSNPSVLTISGSGTSATATAAMNTNGNAQVTAKDAATDCSSDSRNIRVIEKAELDEGMGEYGWCAIASFGSPDVGAACGAYFGISIRVRDWSDQQFAGSDPSCRGSNSAKDAARHARWSCELHSSPLTRDLADTLLDLHERNRDDDTCPGHEMDFNNNEMGRQNAEAGRDCSAAALQALQNGSLQINSPPSAGVTCP